MNRQCDSGRKQSGAAGTGRVEAVGRAAGRLQRVVSCLTVAVVAATWLMACPALGTGPATITLLHVNDTHSHLDAWGPKDRHFEGTLGGMAKAATVIARVRAAEPNVLLLHAGDVFHGDLFFNAYFGVPELRLMRQLGFDAMAVGNHEFDFGPAVLAGSLTAAYGDDTLPLLSANLDLSGYPALTTWIRPALIRDVGGVRIGIFGMTVPDDVMNMPAPVQILGAGDPTVLMGIAAQQVGELRRSGAEVVICLSHLGVLYDRAIAANVPGIDIIVGGHDHNVFYRPEAVANPEGGPTLILQAGSHYEYVGRLRFTVDAGKVRVLSYRLLPVDERVRPLPQVQSVVDDLERGIVATYGDVYKLRLATAVCDLETVTDPDRPERDSAMGDLVTDALRARTSTDIAITANGLIDEGIFRGPIVGVDLFRPVSYGYDSATGLGLKIATLRIAGAELIESLEMGLAYLGINEDFFLQVSGMSFQYDPRAVAGARVRQESVRVHGQSLDPYRIYSVTVNEAIAALLPMMGVDISELQILPDLEYEVLKDHVVGLHRVDVRPEGRIVDISVPRRRHR